MWINNTSTRLHILVTYICTNSYYIERKHFTIHLFVFTFHNISLLTLPVYVVLSVHMGLHRQHQNRNSLQWSASCLLVLRHSTKQSQRWTFPRRLVHPSRLLHFLSQLRKWRPPDSFVLPPSLYRACIPALTPVPARPVVQSQSVQHSVRTARWHRSKGLDLHLWTLRNQERTAEEEDNAGLPYDSPPRKTHVPLL